MDVYELAVQVVCIVVIPKRQTKEMFFVEIKLVPAYVFDQTTALTD